MYLSLCFSSRFDRLCKELRIPASFLKKEIENCFKHIRRKIKAKRIYFDTHGNLQTSLYERAANLISIVTYSVEDMPFYLKRKHFLRDVFHELRHFQQDQIYNWDMEEYTLKDLNEGTSAYYNSQIEKDARKFEKRSIKSYQRLQKSCD